MADHNLTADFLRSVFSYDAMTGEFTRLRKTSNTAKLGTVGHKSKRGAVTIFVLGKKRYAHRLAWLYTFGEWPNGEIDHIDGDPTNNRLANLRIANSAENKQNQRRAKRGNKTGYLGVFLHAPGIWRARIQINGQGKHLGLFRDPESAYSAYVQAKRELHPFCTL